MCDKLESRYVVKSCPRMLLVKRHKYSYCPYALPTFFHYCNNVLANTIQIFIWTTIFTEKLLQLSCSAEVAPHYAASGQFSLQSCLSNLNEEATPTLYICSGIRSEHCIKTHFL